MEIIKIESEEELNLCRKNSYEPLLDPRFDLSIGFRVSVQNLTFGGSPLGQTNITQGNVKFYKWVWKQKTHECEECGRELFHYSSAYVSHILSRKRYPRMRWDGRNTNILCTFHHNQWENEPEQMKIYSANQVIISRLQFEYKGLTINAY